MAEERLVLDLISRLGNELPTRRAGTDSRTTRDDLLKKEEAGLIELSEGGRMNMIATGLAELLESVGKVTPPTFGLSSPAEEAASKAANAQVYLLDLLKKCLSHSWDRSRQAMKKSRPEETDLLKIKEREEQVLPMSLEENLATRLVDLVATILLKPHATLAAELRKKAGAALFQLSATNYDAVWKRIGPHINTPEEENSTLPLVEHLNLNQKRLGAVLETLLGFLNVLKSKLQIQLAKVVKKVVWNWIDSYPMEFVALCQSGARAPGFPDALFDMLDALATKNKTLKDYWPAMTMLLILCPDIMLAITLNKEKSKEVAGKERFLENLKKSLKTPKLSDVGTVCFVDLCRASTFVSKSDWSALRYIVPAIESELKDKLFSPQTPFRDSEGEIDVRLMTDCLVSSYRLNPRKVIGGLFPICLAKDSPAAYRLALVKGLLTIAKEGAALPWNPTFADVYGLISGPLRTLFSELQQAAMKPEVMATALAPESRRDRRIADRIITDLEVLGRLIHLFHLDPELALYPQKASALQEIEEVRPVLTGLVHCTTFFFVLFVSDQAVATLVELHAPALIEKWSRKDPLPGFWEVSSAVITTLANVLTAQKDLRISYQLKLMTVLEQILERRNQFLAAFQRRHPEGSLLPESLVETRSNCNTRLELALLVYLCSPEPEVCSRAAACFGQMCAEVDRLGGETDSHDSVQANYNTYHRIASQGVKVTGRVAQQKAFRNLLRRIEHQTAGNLGAWEELYARWREITPVVKQQEQEQINAAALLAKTAGGAKKQTTAAGPTDLHVEWQHITGSLLALSGVCIKSAIKRGQTTSASTNVDAFFGECLDLVRDDIVNIREPVKMLLGQSVSPVAYPVLFRHMHEVLKTYFGAAGQVLTRSVATLFVDQSIQIVKLMLDLPLESADELSLLTDFELLVLDILRYVSQLLLSVATLVMKRKLCELLDAMMEKRSALPFRNENKFRNALLEQTIEWISDFSNVTSATSSAAAARPVGVTGVTDAEKDLKDLPRTQKDLDLAVMKAVSSLLKGLPLSDTSGRSEESKSQRFLKYFNFFTNLLTRTKKADIVDVPAQLPEFTIQALSSLLTSNIDCGLEHFVTMGYHEDLETRGSFLKVLSNILRQGAEFDVLGEDDVDKYDRLLEFIQDPQMQLAKAIAEVVPVTEADEIASILVRLFMADGTDRALALLKCVIELEVLRTDSAPTLFRRNSMATKMQAAYTKLVGNQYLKETFARLLNDLLSQANMRFELDPQKMTREDDAQVNQYNLSQVCTQYLAAIRTSLNSCPMPLRELCHFIHEVVKAKFPEQANVAVGGFMFLRFLCPAIVAPDTFGILPNIPSPSLRRGLVLVTKVLQNLANVVLFTKEPYMAPMNSFIEQNMPTIRQLFEQYAELPPNAPPAPSISVSDEQKEDDLHRLHHLLIQYQDRISKVLGTEPAAPAGDGSSKGRRQGIADRFAHLMAILASSGFGPGSLFDQFMKKMADKSTDPIKEAGIYYQSGSSKEKQPVFYFIARQLSSDMDTDLLLLHILRTTQSVWNKPFLVVIDLTMFGPENRLSATTCSLFMQHFPDHAFNNLDKVVLIAPNHVFKKYVKGRITKLVGTRIMKKIFFLPTPARLSEFIAPAETNLPAGTLAVDSELKATYDKVIKMGAVGHSPKEVVLRVTNTTLQVISLKLHNIFGRPTSLVDIYHVSNLEEITSSQEYEVVLRITESGGSKALSFRLNQSDQMMQNIKASRLRWALSSANTATVDKSQRTFRPSDVPGTLLNMALLNLGSSRNALRVAAYSLLDALCNTFKFSLRLELCDVLGLSIPRNSAVFVNRISAQLARAEPNLTLEFMRECLLSFSKNTQSGKLLCCEYLAPWLPNLAEVFNPSTAADAPDRQQRARDVLIMMIDMTQREGPLQPAVLRLLWAPFGRIRTVLDPLLDALIAKSLEGGKEADKASMLALDQYAIGEIVVTVAAQNPQLVTGKLIFRILRLLNATATSNKDALDDHECWAEVSVMMRLLLLLSFDNMLHLQTYLPEVFHLAILLFSTGSTLMRATIHALVVNVVQSLYTSVATQEDRLQSLRYLLTELSQLHFRLHFGIGAQQALAFSKPNPKEKKPERMAVQTAQPVAAALLHVLNACAPLNNAVGTPWHSRWLSLAASTAFSSNVALQPRAFVALGVLSIRDASGTSFVSDDLVTEVLLKLKDALLSNINNVGNDLPVSIVLCLSRLYEHLPPTSRFVTPMFWLAMLLAQLGEQRMFAASLTLMENILRVLDSQELFKDSEVAAYLMGTRDGVLDNLLNKLDATTGISFRTSFSFAVAAHLLKGLKLAQTKTITSRVLSYVLELASKRSTGPAVLGYLAALLPLKGDPMLQSSRQLVPAGESLGETQPAQLFFQEGMIPDTQTAALLFTFLVTVLQTSDVEYEQEFIYEALREGVGRMPEAFHVTYDKLIPKMSQVVLNSQNRALVDNVLSIMQAMFKFLADSASSTGSRLASTYLNSIGFQGLPHYDSFTSLVLASHREGMIRIATTVVDHLVDPR